MAFLYVQIRPVGDKRGSWCVLRSNCTKASDYRDFALARQAVTSLASNHPSIFLVVHDSRDRPLNAYAIKSGVWRDLELVV
jgi:hypothetical protein